MIAPMDHDRRRSGERLGASPAASRRADALRVLRAREPVLRAKGVVGVSLFGSVARGDEDAASDVDVILELDDGASLGLFDLVELKEALARELGRPVDVAFRSRLRPWLAARIAPDLVRVF
jgi:predicted nucleotidyltransferase